MYSTEEYEKLIQRNDKYFTVQKFFAYTFGFWPKDPYSKLIRRILFTIWMLIHFLSMLGQTSFFLLNIGEIYNITEVCCTVVTQWCTTVKMLRTYFSQERLTHIIDDMVTHKLLNEVRFLRKDIMCTEVLREQIHEVMDKSWRQSRFAVVLLLRLASPVTILYSIIPLVATIYLSATSENGFTGKLPFRSYYPLIDNIKLQQPYFELFFILDVLAAVACLIGCLTFDGLFVFMAMYATAMVRTLHRMISFSTSQHIPNEIRAEFLKECIQHHTKILGFSTEISNFYSGVNLVQLFSSTALICTIAFHATYNKDNETFSTILMIIYLSAGIYQLGLYCYYGQGLVNESSLISEACYQCHWYECTEDYKKLLRLIMLRTQKTITISAASISQMSLETFSAILRSAASYFTILKTLLDG